MYFLFSLKCRFVAVSPILRICYTWTCLTSELKIHKANKFILSFPHGSWKGQDTPLHCSTTGSEPFIISFCFFPTLAGWDVFLNDTLSLSCLTSIPCFMAESKFSWKGSGTFRKSVVLLHCRKLGFSRGMITITTDPVNECSQIQVSKVKIKNNGLKNFLIIKWSLHTVS